MFALIHKMRTFVSCLRYTNKDKKMRQNKNNNKRRVINAIGTCDVLQQYDFCSGSSALLVQKSPRRFSFIMLDARDNAFIIIDFTNVNDGNRYWNNMIPQIK